MKTVVFRSPFLDRGEFPDARITLVRDVPTQVTDEQAVILLTNPDVSVVASPPVAASYFSSAAPAIAAAAPVTHQNVSTSEDEE